MLQRFRTGDITHLVDHLLNRHRGLGSVSGTAYIRHGGTCLQSQHFRSGSKAYQKFKTTLDTQQIGGQLGIHSIYCHISKADWKFSNSLGRLLHSVHLQRALLPVPDVTSCLSASREARC